MNLLHVSILNIYSALIILIIFKQTLKSAELSSYSSKLFIRILIITFFMLIMDILARFDGHPETIFPYINRIGNFILFSITPYLPSIWLRYVYFQIFKDELKTRKLLIPLTVVAVLNSLGVIVTQFTGLFYTINAANIYQRGDLYFVSNLFHVVVLVMTFVMIVVCRKKVEKEYYNSLIFFTLAPIIGLILQSAIYGVSTILIGVMVSVITVFLNVQNTKINTDYLTNAGNRRRFEQYLGNRIRMANKNKTFSAVTLDLDDFKKINDTYGHDEGDIALQATVDLIKKSIGPKDFVARSGGDEFWIILETQNTLEVDNIITKIKQAFREWNLRHPRPYRLDFSYGFAVYDSDKKMNSEEFQSYVDNLMYENKSHHKSIMAEY